jgi:lipopolysaccharide export system protein LptA
VTLPLARCCAIAGLAGALAAGAASAVGPDLPPFGLGAFARQEPIAITADELDARDQDGLRTLAFRRSVEVRQGPLSLSADVLQAVYASGESQPRQLEARGNVRIHEGTRRAHCQEARYDRPAQRIVCRGNPAELFDADDRLAGSAISFDLGAKSVRVEGGTEVEIQRELRQEDLAEFGADPAVVERVRGKGPLAIHADTLEASDPGTSERRIRFSGGVALRQGDIELRARELEAIYPPGATQPERLIARDDVALREGDRQAHCQRAEYQLRERRLACEGNAVLQERQDRLEGERIAFDFGAQKVDISGRTRLSVKSLRRERDAR